MKRNIIYIFLIILISVIFISPLLQFKFYQSHDGEGHVARFAAYFQAFKDGQFPPRWAGNLNFGYGTPVFIFYYPLPGYIASATHAVGVSYENSFLLLMILSFILAPLFFYFWTSEYLNKEIAFLGALFYGLAPYRFLNTYVRGDIAEMIALTFLPLVFLFIEKFIRSKKTIFILLGGVSYALLILSHNGISLMFSPVLLLYTFIRSKNIKLFLPAILIFVLGLLLSAFFWLPALYEGKYVNTGVFIGSMYKKHFPAPSQLIYSDWGFGPDVQKPGGLSPQIGILYVLLTILGLFLLNKNKKDTVFWLGIFMPAVFITLPFSSIVWERLAILRLYQFPWRFTALSVFAATVIACLTLNSIKSKKIYIVCLLLLILSSMPFIKVKKYETKNDNFYNNYQATTDFGATISIWTEGEPGKRAKSQLELIGGKAKIENFKKKSNLHTFTINAQTNSQILDNTIYFPGWTAKVDGKKVPIEFQDMNHRGFITFYVPAGKHDITIQFTESPVRFISNILSLFGVAAVLLLTLVCLKYKKSL